MAWKCPHCRNEISHLRYEVNTESWEVGDAYLVAERPPLFTTRTRSNIITEYDAQDSGGNDWVGDPNHFECPECNEELQIEELIWEEREQIDNSSIILPGNRFIPPIQEEQMEEENHEIIRPSIEIRNTSHATRRSNFSDQTNHTIICKECRNVFTHTEDHTDTIINCPKCNRSNTIMEFKELIKEGYYEKPWKKTKKQKNSISA